MLGRDIDSGCPIRDHNRTSPRFEIEGILFPMLTLSEAEHGAYHNGNVSDAHNPQRIYDTLWMQAYPVAPRRDPTTEWCFLRCLMLKISIVGSRLAATYQAIVFRCAKSPT